MRANTSKILRPKISESREYIGWTDVDVKLERGILAVQKREGLYVDGTYRYEVATHELISALENTRPSVGSAVLTLEKKI